MKQHRMQRPILEVFGGTLITFLVCIESDVTFVIIIGNNSVPLILLFEYRVDSLGTKYLQ